MRRSLVILYLMFVFYYLLMMANGVVVEKGSAIVLGFNILFFIYMVFINTLRNTHFLKFGYIYLYLYFILFLILISSSQYFDSLKMFAKYGIALMSFPAGFCLIREKKAYKYLVVLSLVFMSLFIINYALSSIFHLGGSSVLYGGDTFIETGNLFDEALYLNVCMFVLAPLFILISEKNLLLKLILLLACVAISIACFKRTVLVCFVLSVLLYIVLTLHFRFRYGKLDVDRSRFKLSLAGKFIVIVSAVAFSYAYKGIVMDQIEARTADLERELDEETRVEEILAIYEDFSTNKTGLSALFGQETFNTVGTYAEGQFEDRMIHTNFGIMLNGTGFVGLFFYIILNLYFLWILIKTARRSLLKENLFARRMFTAYILLWVVYNVSSFSGTIWLTIYPAFTFLVMGAILRYFYDDAVNSSAMVE